MIILDTNVVSALMKGDREEASRIWLDQQPPTSVWTTVITVLECRFGIALLPPGRRREALTLAFAQVVTEDLDGRLLPFDKAAAGHTARLMAQRRVSGRSAELSDGMIAGIAIECRATLATRNVKHFEDAGIDIVNPWHGTAR